MSDDEEDMIMSLLVRTATERDRLHDEEDMAMRLLVRTVTEQVRLRDKEVLHGSGGGGGAAAAAKPSSSLPLDMNAFRSRFKCGCFASEHVPFASIHVKTTTTGWCPDCIRRLVTDTAHQAERMDPLPRALKAMVFAFCDFPCCMQHVFTVCKSRFPIATFTALKAARQYREYYNAHTPHPMHSQLDIVMTCCDPPVKRLIDENMYSATSPSEISALCVGRDVVEFSEYTSTNFSVERMVGASFARPVSSMYNGRPLYTRPPMYDRPVFNVFNGISAPVDLPPPPPRFDIYNKDSLMAQIRTNAVVASELELEKRQIAEAARERTNALLALIRERERTTWLDDAEDSFEARIFETGHLSDDDGGGSSNDE